LQRNLYELSTIVNSVRKPAKNSTPVKEVAKYVIPLGGTGWVVKNRQTKKFTVISDSKREAVKIARSLAKQHRRKLVIFAKDGRIQQQFSYAVWLISSKLIALMVPGLRPTIRHRRSRSGP
jgi:hypothetical protein